jgi:hypothetical protein
MITTEELVLILNKYSLDELVSPIQSFRFVLLRGGKI